MTKLREESIVFNSGKNGKKNKEGVASYRIPALLKTNNGTLIAGVDQRHDHSRDWGDIDLVIRRSSNNGESWGEKIKIISLPKNSDAKKEEENAALNIDMNLIQDPVTKRIFSVYGMYPEGKALFGQMESGDQREQYIEISGEYYLALYTKEQETPHTVRENGIVYTPKGKKTDYRVVMKSEKAPYQNLGNIYHHEEYLGNIYFNTNQKHPFTISTRTYIWLSYSDDDGLTWSTPKDITSQVRKPWMSFYGVGPGIGTVLDKGPHKGRLVIPTYSTNHPTDLVGSQSARIIYSDDHGQTWKSGEAVNDNRLLTDGKEIHSSTMNCKKAQNTESVALQLENGEIKLFMRNLTGHLQMATSKDGGESWSAKVEEFPEIKDVYVQLSAIQTIQDGVEYIILVNANGPGRFNGHIRLARVENGQLNWIDSQLLQEGEFAYNAIQQIGNQEYGVLYEHVKEPHNTYQILYKSFDWSYLNN